MKETNLHLRVSAKFKEKLDETCNKFAINRSSLIIHLLGNWKEEFDKDPLKGFKYLFRNGIILKSKLKERAFDELLKNLDSWVEKQSEIPPEKT